MQSDRVYVLNKKLSTRLITIYIYLPNRALKSMAALIFHFGCCTLALNLVLLATLALLLPRAATATDFTVGDENGWNTGTNYLTWSQKYNFTVGDVLGKPSTSVHVKSND